MFEQAFKNIDDVLRKEDKPYRWETWAAPKGKDGKLDHNTAMTGDDLRDFVRREREYQSALIPPR